MGQNPYCIELFSSLKTHHFCRAAHKCLCLPLLDTWRCYLSIISIVLSDFISFWSFSWMSILSSRSNHAVVKWWSLHGHLQEVFWPWNIHKLWSKALWLQWPLPISQSVANSSCSQMWLLLPPTRRSAACAVFSTLLQGLACQVRHHEICSCEVILRVGLALISSGHFYSRKQAHCGTCPYMAILRDCLQTISMFQITIADNVGRFQKMRLWTISCYKKTWQNLNLLAVLTYQQWSLPMSECNTWIAEGVLSGHEKFCRVWRSQFPPEVAALLLRKAKMPCPHSALSALESQDPKLCLLLSLEVAIPPAALV